VNQPSNPELNPPLNAQSLDGHMRISTCKWSLSTALIIAVTVPSAFAEDEGHPARAHLSKALVDAMKANPCHLLEEMFRVTDDPKGACSKLRKPNGELLLSLTLKDGDDLVELAKVGQRCRGSIVAADVRPKKVPRWVSYHY
jgi:hypothetical protein